MGNDQLRQPRGLVAPAKSSAPTATDEQFGTESEAQELEDKGRLQTKFPDSSVEEFALLFFGD
jgi:hypothetical protein